MASVNKVILVGRVGKDPEARSMQNGNEVVSFSVATSEKWNDKQTGESKEKTEWHSVVIFNEGLCKVAKQYLRKGSQVYIEGQLQNRKWQDQSGANRYSTEVVLQRFRGELVLIGGKPEGATATDKWNAGFDRQTGSASPPPQQGYDSDLDDDVPFIASAWHLERRVS